MMTPWALLMMVPWMVPELMYDWDWAYRGDVHSGAQAAESGLASRRAQLSQDAGTK